MATAEFDMSEFREFFERMGRAARGDFRKEMEEFLEGIGFEFLRIVEDEFIKRHKNTGEGLLVASFRKGGKGNVWKLEDNGLTLEVGTNVEYASYVNYGHRTFDPEKTNHFKLPNGELARFVPGHWEGNRFVFDKNADSGMVLKLHFVEGIHFWEPSIEAIKHIYQKALERKLQEWIDRYFGI